MLPTRRSPQAAIRERARLVRDGGETPERERARLLRDGGETPPLRDAAPLNHDTRSGAR